MSHPILQGLDVADLVLQVARRERMTELVKKEFRTIWSLRACCRVSRRTVRSSISGEMRFV